MTARPEECSVGAIILAAGQARRMGELKQLLPWRGSTIIERVVDCVIASGLAEIIVVVGHRASEVSQKLAGKPIKIVVNPDYYQGISSSLIFGLKALGEKCQGYMVVLGDQPALEAPTLCRLVEAFSQHPAIVVPIYQGRRGHPVIFPSRYRGELMALMGDRGARSVVESHPDDIIEIEVDTDSIVQDVDDREDYQSLHSRLSEKE